MRRAVFLDRDDTLIANRSVTEGTAHPGDLVDPALVRLLPGVAEGCRRLREAGFALVVVSNQGCVARGVCTTREVEAVNARMAELLRAQGAALDGVYYCPYHPKGTIAPFNIEHDCRKPAPGMLVVAGAELGLDLRASWMIGDATRDMIAATRAGIPPARALLLGVTCPTFAAAVERVLRG
jgi:D-glycero-D-manno-heptose 1,7-bisphosphate phosphatase